MSRRLLVLVAAGSVLALLGLLAVAYLSGPLRQASGRVCSGCVETHWNGRSTLRAGTVSGAYRFANDATYLIRFSGGEVTLAGHELAPGCLEGHAAEGAVVDLNEARDLRLQAPAPEGGCADTDAASSAP